jgi:ribosomal protein S18 acetylase RimI-like enzyme
MISDPFGIPPTSLADLSSESPTVSSLPGQDADPFGIPATKITDATPEETADMAADRELQTINHLRMTPSDVLQKRFKSKDDVVSYYVENEAAINGDREAKDKILEAFEAKRREGTSTASKVGGFLSGATSTVWNMIKATPAAMADVGNVLLHPEQSAASLIANNGPAARVAAAVELDAAQVGKLANDMFTLDPEEVADVWQKELAKVSPEARPAFEETVKDRIREIWDSELTRQAEWQKQLTKTQRGQGAIREGTPLEGVAPMSEKQTERAGAISEVVGLSNFLGAGPGAKAATTIAKKSALRTAIGNFAASGLEKVAKTAEATAGKASKAGKFFTPTRALTTEVAGNLLGVPGVGLGTKAVASIAPKVVRGVGKAADTSAKIVRGTIPPGPLLRTAIAATKGAGKGALGGLGFYGDPEALLFTGLQLGAAYGAGTSDELVTGLAQQAGTGATFGVGAVAGQGAMKVPDWVKTKSSDAYKTFARTIWLGAPGARGPIESKPYGIVPELDAAHEAAISKLPESHQNAINAAREVFRQQDRDVYALTPEAFQDILHQREEEALGRPLTEGELESVRQQAANASGVFYADFNLPNGKTRGAIFLNTDGGALQHESGHLLLNLLDDQQKAELRASVPKFYTPEQIQTFRSEYEALINKDKPPAEQVLLSDEYVVDEIIAENLDALQNAVSIEEFGTPQPLARKMRLFAGSWLEKFGATPAKTAGIETDLGVTPSAQFARVAEAAIRARLEGTQAPTVSEIKPFARPEQAAAPVAPMAATPTPAPAAANIPVQPAAAPTAPNIRVTPAQQSQLSAPQPAAGEPPLRTQPTLPVLTGVDEARASLDSDTSATPATKQVFEDIAREIETPSADQAPLEIEYNSAESKTFDANRRERAKERQSVYDAVPNAIRKLAQKIFVPYKFGFGKEGKPIVHAWSMDKLLSNVDRIIGMAAARKIESKIPYATAGGKLTNASTQQLMSDIQTYSANQIRGYAGSGERITNIPQNYYGELNPESPEGPAGKISEDKARFINLLLGTDVGPPSTTRKSDRPVPANVSAQQLAEINLRPIEESTRGKTGQTFKTSGYPNQNIAELNPLRAELRKAGVDVDALETVQERLRVDLIESTKRRPDLFLPGFKLDAGRAGFKPATVSATPSEAETRLAEEGYSFKRYGDGAARGINVNSPEGELVGGIAYSLVKPTEAYVDMISLIKPFRGKGIGEALYRQMARDLQSLGVTDVQGEVFSKAAAGARDKVLGTASTEGDLAALPEFWSNKSNAAPVNVRSKIDPNAQYKPAAKETFTKKGIEDLPTTTGWAILTAENPRTREDLTKPLPTVENLERQDRLRRALDKAGYEYIDPREGTEGKYGLLEHPFIVFGITPKEAHDLGNQFEQDSVAIPDGLLYHTGDLEAAKGTVTLHKKAPKDYFTKLPDGTKFTLDIDFSERKPYEGLNQELEARDTSEDAVGGQIKLVHFSDGDFKATDPKFFGKGAATATDQKGMKKTYFFEEGSKTGADRNLTVNKNVYTAEIDGSKIYDGNKDPLNWRGEANREQADQMLIDAGFRGLVSNSFGRDTVALFDKQPVKFVGRTDAKGMAKADTTGFSQGQFKPKTDTTAEPIEAVTDSVDVMESEDPFAPLGGKPGEKINVVDRGRMLAERAKKLAAKAGVRVSAESRTPKVLRLIAAGLAKELKWATENLKNGLSGIGWYDSEVTKAFAALAKRWPELADKDSPERSFMTGLMAITSNGQEVTFNMDRAVQLYDKWKRTGELEVDGAFGGTRQPQINAALALLDQVFKKLGPKEAAAFLKREFTVKQLNDAGFSFLEDETTEVEEEDVDDQPTKKKKVAKVVNGELVDHVVNGSAIFGPKIGAAFYQNLIGNFTPFTMDVWFSRTMNRHNGSYGRGIQEKIDKTLATLRKRLTAAGKTDIADLSDRKLGEWALLEEKRIQSEFTGGDKKTREDWEKSVGGASKALKGAVDAPRSGSERQWFRDIFAEVDRIREEEGLPAMTNADKQAVLWYYEKALYTRLGSRQKTLGVSYAGAVEQALRYLDDPTSRPLKVKKGKKGKVDANQSELDLEDIPIQTRKS